MTDRLLESDEIDIDPEQYLRSVGHVFAEFGELTQDSGNISYGVEVNGARYFVKTAGRQGPSRGVLEHAARIKLLRNSVGFRAACSHPALPKLYRVIESPTGPLLVYEWLDGELLGVARERRDDPSSAFQRFRRQPLPRILTCLDEIFDLHEQIARVGWVAVDFYDGCLIYDFVFGHLGVVDLDMYNERPFINRIGRMFGSTRFMSPEEFELGALIDEQSNVFVMGRAALVFLSDGTLNDAAFRGPRALFNVAAQAVSPERSLRFDSMAAFSQAWRIARAGSTQHDT